MESFGRARSSRNSGKLATAAAAIAASSTPGGRAAAAGTAHETRAAPRPRAGTWERMREPPGRDSTAAGRSRVSRTCSRRSAVAGRRDPDIARIAAMEVAAAEAETSSGWRTSTLREGSRPAKRRGGRPRAAGRVRRRRARGAAGGNEEDRRGLDSAGDRLRDDPRHEGDGPRRPKRFEDAFGVPAGMSTTKTRRQK